MDFRARVEMAMRRAGFHSQEALASACGVKQPSINALLTQRFPMHELLGKVAQLTGVSVNWLRDGLPADAPPWASGPLVEAIHTSQELANRLEAMRIERDAALAERDAMRRERDEAVQALAKLAVRLTAETPPVGDQPGYRKTPSSATIAAVREAKARDERRAAESQAPYAAPS